MQAICMRVLLPSRNVNDVHGERGDNGDGGGGGGGGGGVGGGGGGGGGGVGDSGYDGCGIDVDCGDGGVTNAYMDDGLEDARRLLVMHHNRHHAHGSGLQHRDIRGGINGINGDGSYGWWCENKNVFVTFTCLLCTLRT
jgi:hypothetical protein